jgi:predicted nucleic acid-binding protein
MTTACFVDANVLVYSTDRSEPSKLEIARALLQKFWREQRTRIKTAAARRRLPGALRSE